MAPCITVAATISTITTANTIIVFLLKRLGNLPIDNQVLWDCVLDIQIYKWHYNIIYLYINNV